MNGYKMRVHGKLLWRAALLVSLVLALSAPSAHAQPDRWRTEFYANKTLSGPPVLTRTDAAINFNWGTGAPDAGVPADNFSARWTRTEWFEAGNCSAITKL